MVVEDDEKREYVRRAAPRTQRPERMRHIQEISARYDQARHEYQQLLKEKRDNREQRVMLYAEIKALGWCMGRNEQTVIREINDPDA